MSMKPLRPYCDRCGEYSTTTTGSWFTSEMICKKCATLERQHPQFEEAKQAVLEHERMGDMNWEGIGLPTDLQIKSF